MLKQKAPRMCLYTTTYIYRLCAASPEIQTQEVAQAFRRASHITYEIFEEPDRRKRGQLRSLPNDVLTPGGLFDGHPLPVLQIACCHERQALTKSSRNRMSLLARIVLAMAGSYADLARRLSHRQSTCTSSTSSRTSHWTEGQISTIVPSVSVVPNPSIPQKSRDVDNSQSLLLPPRTIIRRMIAAFPNNEVI